jgi:metal-dependent amidase/aminoacylase/carboxypeptidase family protein
MTGGEIGTGAAAKEAAASVIDRHLADLVALSHSVHATPELCFNETRSAAAVADALRAGGLAVTEGVYDLPTALESRAGDGDLVVAVCAEYDALPDVGHACGHNIIAASAVGAGLALAAVADEVGLQVRVLGTPAEEGGGGKVFMLDRGAFDGVHAAMMVHPWPTERLTGACLAVSHFDVHFSGREAHASAAPWEGVNALDAMTVSQVASGAANVIPASVTGRFMVRSRTLEALGAAAARVRACFEAGALATGCTVTYEELSPDYSHMEADAGLLSAYRVNAEALGRTFEADDADAPLPTFSTDMANVSLAVPTIHPLIGIETHGAVNHQPDFTAACITASADRAVRDGAVALAWTAIDAATESATRQRLLGA